MRWIAAIAVLVAASAARADDARVTLTGKVVAVFDGNRLAVYLDEVRASYRICLSGVNAPNLGQSLGPAAREALAQMVLGREIEIDVAWLSNAGEIPAEVFLNGQSVNDHLAKAWPSRAMVQEAAVDPHPRRIRLALWTVLRVIPPWRDACRL